MVDRTSGSNQRSPWARYGAAVGVVALGWLAREALSRGIGPTALPFIFFFPAVAVAAWYGRLGPGLLAIGLSMLAANWFFSSPTHTLRIRSTYDLVALLSFALAALLIVGAVEAMHRARAQAASIEKATGHSRDLLATTLASIGDGVIVTDAWDPLESTCRHASLSIL